jgi:hypothetical protein
LLDEETDEENIDLESDNADEEEEEEDEESSFLDSACDASNLVVENEYVSEKLAAIYLIQEITKYPNGEFYEFYDDSFLELKHLLNFVNMNIRKQSFLALAHLISYFHDSRIKIALESGAIVEETTHKSIDLGFLVFLPTAL